MKAIRIFLRNVSSALKSISRNFSLSLASIICSTITLLMVAIAIALVANINNFTTDLEKTLTILVFVEKDATTEDISAVKSQILQIKNIKTDEIQDKDKEKIKEETLEKLCTNVAEEDKANAICKVINSWTEETNPLQHEFIISVKDASQLNETVDILKSIPNVEHIEYSKDISDKMVPVFNAVSKFTWLIVGSLIIVTIFLIINTIKLTIFARRNEIEIMRLVGTSNFVIKLPFVIEGLFLGLIGSIVPIIATIWGYSIMFERLEGHLFTNLITLLQPMPFTIFVSLIVAGMGALVGMIGSYITVRKYLKI